MSSTPVAPFRSRSTDAVVSAFGRVRARRTRPERASEPRRLRAAVSERLRERSPRA